MESTPAPIRPTASMRLMGIVFTDPICGEVKQPELGHGCRLQGRR